MPYTVRPLSGGADSHFEPYLSAVPDGDIIATLQRDLTETLALLRPVSEEHSLSSYAPGKWTLRSAVQHVIDLERVFIFRALWIARGFTESLPGFDDSLAASNAGGDARSLSSLLDEFASLRQATIEFARSLPDHAWARQGTASGYLFSVRALIWITAGHSIHHRRIAAERYLS